MVYELYEIYQNTGRPSRYLSSHDSLEEAREELEFIASNELDEQNYCIVERTEDQDPTYRNERGFEYFSYDVNIY